MNEILGLIIRRTGSAILVLFIVVTSLFFFMRLAGDPVVLLAGNRVTAEAKARIQERLGLDHPMIKQYTDYLGGVVKGDFGQSSRYNTDAMHLVLERVPATFQLGGMAILLAVVIAVPVGILSALKPGSIADSISRFVAVIGQSIPVFWLAIVLIVVFALKLHVLPAGGRGSFQQLILPALCLSVLSIPMTMRLTRATMLEVLGQDYIRTARAKGLREPVVILRHALRNAAIPIITVLGLRIGHIMAGAIMIEEVFAYPGVGRLALGSMLNYDYSVIQAFVFAVALMVVATNLVVDILYGIVDPRVRVS
jgi:peptide/nickel transport system permease protein